MNEEELITRIWLKYKSFHRSETNAVINVRLDKALREILKEGFQKGKLEQKKEELEFLLKIQNWFDTATGQAYEVNNRIKQLQKEIGDDSQQSLGIGSLGKGTSDDGLHNPNSYVGNSPKLNFVKEDKMENKETISSLIEKTKKEIEKWILKHYENSGSRVCQVFDYKRELAEARLKALNECAEIFRNKINELYLDKCKEQGLDKSEWTEAEMFSLNELEKEIGEEKGK